MNNEQKTAEQNDDPNVRALEMSRQYASISDNPWASFQEYIDMIDDAQDYRRKHIGDIEYVERMMEPVYKRKN